MSVCATGRQRPARVSGTAAIVAFGLNVYPQGFFFDADIVGAVTGYVPWRAYHLDDWGDAETRAWSVNWVGRSQSIVAPNGPITLPDALDALAGEGARFGSMSKLRVSWNDGGTGNVIELDVCSGGTLQLPPCNSVSVDLLVPQGNGVNGAAILGRGAGGAVAGPDAELVVVDTPASVEQIEVAASFDKGASSRAVLPATYTQWLTFRLQGDREGYLMRPPFARRVCVSPFINPFTSAEESTFGALLQAQFLAQGQPGFLASSDNRLGARIPIYEDVCVPGHARGIFLAPEPDADPQVDVTWTLSL